MSCLLCLAALPARLPGAEQGIWLPAATARAIWPPCIQHGCGAVQSSFLRTCVHGEVVQLLLTSSFPD